MRTGLTKREKTTDIWFDEKDPLIHIRTHNTDLKKRLAAYAGQHPDQCRQTDADPDTGCMEFEIRKGRFSFRLTAPYNEERRRAASEAAKIAGLSRSAYYKYKDGVRPFFEATTDRIVTYHFMLHDQPGVLSSILGLMARSGANLLTVNQSIPMRGMASVTISARTGEMKYSSEELVHRAEAMEGVSKVEILASE